MSRRRGIMSESFKYELAKDLGFYDVVQREGWEGIRTKDAGNMVKRAIQIAEEHLTKQYNASAPSMSQSQSSYNSPQSYNQPINQTSYKMKQSYSQSPSSYGYGGGQQPQSSSQPAYSPMTNNFGINSYVPSTMPSYPNQPYTASLNQLNAGAQQAWQAEQRPYKS